MNKLYNGIMGLVVGDALGVPVEFRKRDTYKVTDMIGFGTYNQKPGTWSDDSSLTLATLESIGRKGKIDLENIMKNFLDWLENGGFTPYGKAFDVGGTTRRAIQRFQRGVEPLNCGGKSINDNGNGALMRILPLAFIEHKVKDVIHVGQLTHAHNISQTACCLYVYLAELLIKGLSLKNVICSLDSLSPVVNMEEFKRLAYIGELKRYEIRSSGYVVDTLEAALWCLWTTDTYKDCVLTAVNLGEDTDTVAAVAGGLAGIYYGVGGETGIPERWINKIACKNRIRKLCDAVQFIDSGSR